MMSTAAEKPNFTFADIQKLGRFIQMYSVHPEALRVISSALGDKEHIEEAIKRRQTEFLIIPMDVVPPEQLEFVTQTLHAIRGKQSHRFNKPTGLQEKGYMLVHEPEAIAILKQQLKGSYISMEPRHNTSVID